MFNITNDKRRATVDIDIDLIRYSLEDKSILLLFDKLNQVVAINVFIVIVEVIVTK